MNTSPAANASGRFLTLDALRGIAAILVVAAHAELGLPGGFFAVDFFFILSGLVISRTYQVRLESGLGFVAFIKSRLIRLYPLFALGLTLDALRVLAMALAGKSHTFGAIDVGVNFLREALVLPSAAKWPALFWLNVPAWSLFMELVVNVLFALLLFRCRTVVLAAIAIAAFAANMVAAHALGTYQLGNTWATLLPGLVRTLFGFSAGVLIGRLRPDTSSSTWWMLLLPVALVVCMVTQLAFLRDAFIVGIAMPALVYLGARFEPPARLRTLAGLLGEVSYPIYAIHWPILYALESVSRALHRPDSFGQIWTCVLILPIGLLVSRFFDLPVRRALNGRRPAALQQVPLAERDAPTLPAGPTRALVGEMPRSKRAA